MSRIVEAFVLSSNTGDKNNKVFLKTKRGNSLQQIFSPVLVINLKNKTSELQMTAVFYVLLWSPEAFYWRRPASLLLFFLFLANFLLSPRLQSICFRNSSQGTSNIEIRFHFCHRENICMAQCLDFPCGTIVGWGVSVTAPQRGEKCPCGRRLRWLIIGPNVTRCQALLMPTFVKPRVSNSF